MEYNWYFSKNHNVNDQLIDEFVDSKFGIDKWTSFAREIIQNSIDAKDEDLGNNIPVKVVFELNKYLSINDIPGAERIGNILKLCIDNITNIQTKEAYNAGIDILKKKNIYCLKISDYNTIGVKSGRDEAWGALVYDTGKSCKPRPGSAGSYGVGKKVPFIISAINTVFYVTKNKTDSLVEGKSILVDYVDENGIRRSHIGWYGVENKSTDDHRNKVAPINTKNETELNPFFVRKESLGTDVIIVGVDIYNQETDIAHRIIKAVLENFFIAIKHNKLCVEIKGFIGNGSIIIDKEHFDDILTQFYDENNSVHRETETLIVGNLVNYIKALTCEPEVIEISDDCLTESGKLIIYYMIQNSKNKRYYSIVRNHGMKICDYYLLTEQPFTAVVYIEGKQLNEKLSELENAAHDNFCVQDRYCSEESVKLFKKIKKLIENRLKELCKIEVGDNQSIDGLDDMLALPGKTENISKKDIKQRIRKKHIVKPKPPKPHKPLEPSTPIPKEPDPKEPGEPRHRKIRNKKKIVESFKVSPKSIISNESYHITFATNREILSGGFQISAIDNDNKQDESIAELIQSIKVDGNKKHYASTGVSNLTFHKNELVDVEVVLKTKALYKLDISVFENIKELS